MEIKSGMNMKRPRLLRCCCCGQPTLGRQWWNRDTGFGICERCIEPWIEGEMRSSHVTREEAEASLGYSCGIRGVHFNVKDTDTGSGI